MPAQARAEHKHEKTTKKREAKQFIFIQENGSIVEIELNLGLSPYRSLTLGLDVNKAKKESFLCRL